MGGKKFLVLLFAFSYLEVKAEFCTRYIYSRQQQMYCKNGCCGSFLNRYCCEDENGVNRYLTSETHMSAGAIVGIVIGVLFVIAIISTVSVMVLWECCGCKDCCNCTYRCSCFNNNNCFIS